jgi:uncharacterized protein
MTDTRWIAVLSDTHGILPTFVTQALEQLPPVHIFHAGDVCDAEILDTLRNIAPLTWVRGNMDSRKTGDATAVADIDGMLFYVLHNLYDLDIDPRAAGMAAVIHGHLHAPSIEWRDRVLFLNPGSCAYPRGYHAPSYARIELKDSRLLPEIVYER